MSLKEVVSSLSSELDLRPLTNEETEKLKKILIENYIKIQTICEENNITIMLGGGSALGAIRHKGFIPWDDDLDVLMPRRDFEKFKKIFDEKFGENYMLSSPNYYRKSGDRFPKILIKNTNFKEFGSPTDERACIKIDVFILENVHDNKILRLLHGIISSATMFIASCVDIFEQNDSFKDYMCRTKEGKKLYSRRSKIGMFFSFFSADKWFDFVDKVCQYRKETNLLGIPTGRKHYFGEILPKDAYLPVSTGIFDGYVVNIPQNTDLYLSNLYGDYMKIPPVESREHHYILDIDFGEL